MRQGWTDKEAAIVLGVAPTKVSQALTPALRKVALLMAANPLATLRAIMEAMDDLRGEQDLARRREAEQAFRREVLTGTTGGNSADSRRTTLPPRPISTRGSNL